MFSLDQIHAAHGKVKSGADFPAYVRELAALGLKNYITSVDTGATVYHGDGGYSVSSPAKYDALPVADSASAQDLQMALKIHQAGQTDYPTFCRQAAEAGVASWITDIERGAVIFRDKAGATLLTEQIPG